MDVVVKYIKKKIKIDKVIGQVKKIHFANCKFFEEKLLRFASCWFVFNFARRFFLNARFKCVFVVLVFFHSVSPPKIIKPNKTTEKKQTKIKYIERDLVMVEKMFF